MGADLGTPAAEGVWAQLVRALHQAGRPQEAIAAYEQIRDHLPDELGVEPGRPLRELHERLLDSSCAAIPRQLPAPIAHFTGRATELARLTTGATGGAAVVVTAADGTAGIGSGCTRSRTGSRTDSSTRP